MSLTAPDKATDPAPLPRTLALVGLMGVGKTSIGKKLAAALNLPFRDTDAEVERAAGRTVAEIFEELGEPAFREGERRVIQRLLAEGPQVLAAGGGAFAQAPTREAMKAGALVVWLKADLDVLARRVARKDNRPLVRGRDPMEVLQAQADARYPFFAQAHLHVETGDVSHAASVALVLEALEGHGWPNDKIDTGAVV